MKRKLNHIRIVEDNNHLLDIFDDNYYIELGNISLETLDALLNNHLIKLEDITDFENQNLGIGASTIDNPWFRNIFPYTFFDNISKVDGSFQLYIAYGLALYYDEQYKQKFSPLVLIPVNIFFEDGACLFQIAALPFSNPVFVEKMRSNGYAINHIGNDYSLFALDKYCNQFSNYENIEVRIGNYLTIARVINPQSVLNHEVFSLRNEFREALGSKAYINENNRIYNITNLDSRQRLAVQRASTGNSFGLTGYLGTGKTNTLINIASDSIGRDKRVLYISNIRETLHTVEKVFNEHSISGLLMDLTKSSRSTVIGNSLIESSIEDEIDEEVVLKTLSENYGIIDNYENNLTKRFYNFRFIDILKEIIMIQKPKEDFSIDNLDGLYKHEYEEIFNSLKAIESQVKKIPQFMQSKFINIPINHNIKYPNQIMTMLFQLNKSFKELDSYRNTLVNDYKFKDIVNYAMFRNVINNFTDFDPDKLPLSWKTDHLSNFNKAIEVYPNLKSVVYSIQEMELYIDWDYKDLGDFNIDQAIDSIYGKYFVSEDKSKINFVLDNIGQIKSKLQVGKYNSDVYIDQLNRAKNIFDWRFNDDNDESIDFILSVINYLNNNYIFSKWLNQKNYRTMRNQIQELKTELELYNHLNTTLTIIFGNISDINQSIALVERFIATGKTPKKFQKLDLEEIKNQLLQLKDKTNSLRKLKYDYYAITGRDYSPEDDMLLAFDSWHKFVKGIKNTNFKNKMKTFLASVNSEYYQNFLNELNKFARIHNETSKIYDYVVKITSKDNALNYQDRVNKINDFVLYINTVYDITMEMGNIIRVKKTYSDIDSYLLLKNRINKLSEVKTSIVGNSDYKYLFGSLFEDDKTNVNELANYIKFYSNYTNCYIDGKAVENSLQDNNYKNIQNIVKQSEKTIYEINESFKLYSKIFKDGVGDFYYDDFIDNIEVLTDLLGAKDELIAYLDITDNLKVLQKYKLFILINLITSNKIDNASTLFKYKYFNNLYHSFMVDHIFLDSKQLEEALIQISEGEDLLIKMNINHLRNLKAAKIAHIKQKNTNYRHFVKRSSKSLFLATTSVLNNYLDINDFDVVLIDDAQMLHANEYYKAIQGKQIIIAGDNISGISINPNIIARMRSSNIMNLNYRYSTAPLSLIDNLPNTKGQFYPEVKLNEGYKYTNKNEIVTISELLLENENYTINFYTQSIARKREISEGVVKYLLSNQMNENIVYDIIRNKLNFLDFDWFYSMEADFSIINIIEIIELPDDKLKEANIRNILLAKVNVIIIDEENIISSDVYNNNGLISKVIKKPLYEFNPKSTIIFDRLKDSLAEMGISVMGTYSELDLVLEKFGLYYGVILYSDSEKSHFDILSNYRRHYLNNINNGFPVIKIWILDLVNDYDNVVRRIGELVNYEQE